MKRLMVVTSLLAVVWSLALSGVGWAAAHNGQCESGEACVYRDDQQNGARSDYIYADSNYSGDTFDYQPWTCGICYQNDNVSSMWNKNATYKLRFFVDAYHDGNSQTLATLGYDNLANYNDAYSSHCFNNGAITNDPDCAF